MKHEQEKNKRIGWEDGISTGGGSPNELMRRGKRVLIRWRLKGCPRCKGDVVVELDQWGRYEKCIQCGYMLDLQNVVEIKQQAAQQRHNLEY